MTSATRTVPFMDLRAMHEEMEPEDGEREQQDDPPEQRAQLMDAALELGLRRVLAHVFGDAPDDSGRTHVGSDEHLYCRIR